MEREAAYPSELAPDQELVESVIAALEARGVPQGTWLMDINRVRLALREADTLLRRLEEAVIRGASSTQPPA